MAMDPKTVENIKLTLNQVKEILEPLIEITDQVRQIVSNILEPVAKFLTFKSDFFDNKQSMMSGINSNFEMVNVVPIAGGYGATIVLGIGSLIGSALLGGIPTMLKK